jgi:hypothetical protein
MRLCATHWRLRDGSRTELNLVDRAGSGPRLGFHCFLRRDFGLRLDGHPYGIIIYAPLPGLAARRPRGVQSPSTLA